MTEITVILNEDERAELLRILNRELGDVRVEVHRTHSPEFREFVKTEEGILRRLSEKLRQAAAPVSMEGGCGCQST